MANGVHKADHSRDDLQVEKAARCTASLKMAEPYFLAAGMNDDAIGRIDHDLPEAIERTCCQRIDQIETLGRGHLQQAEMRMITVFADELRIEAKIARGSQMFAASDQFVRLLDDLFGQLGKGRAFRHKETMWMSEGFQQDMLVIMCQKRHTVLR